MAVFTNGVVPWNSLDDNTRIPLTSELEGGYPCGQADQQLFNFTAAYPWGQVHNVLLNSGVTPSLPNLSQLSMAIQSGRMNYAVAGGSANALTASFSPPITSNAATAGMVIAVTPSTTSTSSSVTLSVSGLAALPIQRSGGRALSVGDINPGALVVLVGTGSSWQVVSGLGRQYGRSILTTSGSFTVPAGVRTLFVRVWGGGGGGGGGAATTGTSFAGTGGGGGGYADGFVTVTPGQVITFSIGAGGAGGAPLSPGVAGGTTSFLGLSATGGGGGRYQQANSTENTGPGSGSGGFNLSGGYGGIVMRNGSTSEAYGGAGGSGAMGGQGAVASTSLPAPGIMPGGGGGGAGGPGGLSGGQGAAGLAVIEY